MDGATDVSAHRPTTQVIGLSWTFSQLGSAGMLG
jgi:hypothetical protein